MHEEWKPINGFEGLYEISSYGRVKSFKVYPSGKILKPSPDLNGYLRLSLVKEGKNKYVNVHRLVAEAFLPRISGKTCVNHIDGNKTNNLVSNLRWVTNKENTNNPITINLKGVTPMILKSTAEQVLAAALRTGGDFAELFCEDRRSGGMGLVDGHVENASTVRRHGAGIRVYNGLNSVYVHTNDTGLSGLMSAARKAADAVSGSGAVGDIRLVRSVAANVHPIKALPMDVAGARKAKLLRDMDLAARAVSPEIRQVRANLIYWDSEVQIANSEGLFTGDRRVYTRAACSAVAEGNGESQSGSASPGAMMGFELFEGRVDVAEQARIAANRAVTMLHAEPCPAGVMPVVIDGGFGGVIFHEACGHSLEAQAVAFGNSEFAGRLGERIASPIVTAVDDGTLPGEWGSLNIDDEGTPTTRLVLIQDGVRRGQRRRGGDHRHLRRRPVRQIHGRRQREPRHR